MSKISIILSCTLFLFFTACSSGNFGEVKKIYRESNSISARFIKNIDKADTAEKTAKAIQTYNQAMTILQNRYKVYLAENPGVSEQLESAAEAPEELSTEFEESTRLNNELMNSLKKVMRFLEDKSVAAELKNMESILGELR